MIKRRIGTRSSSIHFSIFTDKVGIFLSKIYCSEATTVVSKKVPIFASNELKKDRPYAIPDWNTEF